ncbi:MAG: flagellar biosynthetic protein FliO [Proteobacteria bacterium]|nr:flagellar biosynthetic protein FliO [Pseudomonadota bacterium]
MESYFFWTFMLAILAVASAGAVVFVRAYLTGTSPSALLFRPKVDRRLEVIDHASIDGRRKLILIRRDDVEHLLLTGGPVDVVVETGIKAPAPRPVAIAPAETPPPARRTPVFGQSPEVAPALVPRERNM